MAFIHSRHTWDSSQHCEIQRCPRGLTFQTSVPQHCSTSLGSPRCRRARILPPHRDPARMVQSGLSLSAAPTTANTQPPAGMQPDVPPLQQALQQALRQYLPQYFKPIHQKLQTPVHRTSPALWSARQHNSRALLPTDALAPVPHPDTGVLPLNFPATNNDLEMLSYAQLGKLLAFYGESLAGGTLARRNRLKAFIGKQ
ncbi:hypothetical protein ABPG77_005559 [Micractinium sp. CCAP 211/92]